jgi:hypothetical protein
MDTQQLEFPFDDTFLLQNIALIALAQISPASMKALSPSLQGLSHAPAAKREATPAH